MLSWAFLARCSCHHNLYMVSKRQRWRGTALKKLRDRRMFFLFRRLRFSARFAVICIKALARQNASSIFILKRLCLLYRLQCRSTIVQLSRATAYFHGMQHDNQAATDLLIEKQNMALHC